MPAQECMRVTLLAIKLTERFEQRIWSTLKEGALDRLNHGNDRSNFLPTRTTLRGVGARSATSQLVWRSGVLLEHQNPVLSRLLSNLTRSIGLRVPPNVGYTHAFEHRAHICAPHQLSLCYQSLTTEQLEILEVYRPNEHEFADRMFYSVLKHDLASQRSRRSY